MTRKEAEALGWVFSPPSPTWHCAWRRNGLGTRDMMGSPTEEELLTLIERRQEMRKSKPPLPGSGVSTQGYGVNEVIVRQRES